MVTTETTVWHGSKCYFSFGTTGHSETLEHYIYRLLDSIAKIDYRVNSDVRLPGVITANDKSISQLTATLTRSLVIHFPFSCEPCFFSKTGPGTFSRYAASACSCSWYTNEAIGSTPTTLLVPEFDTSIIRCADILSTYWYWAWSLLATRDHSNGPMQKSSNHLYKTTNLDFEPCSYRRKRMQKQS